MASSLLLSLLVLCSHGSLGLAVAASHQQHKSTVVSRALVPSSRKAACSTLRGTPFPNHGPCSPVPTKTKLPHTEIIRRDHARRELIRQGGVTKATERTGPMKSRQVVEPNTPFQSPEELCSTSRGTSDENDVSVPLAKQNGPCSPVLTKTELPHAEMLHQDHERRELIRQGGIAEVGPKKSRQVVVANTSFQSPEQSCSISRGSPKSGRMSVPLAHRYGPCASVQTKDQMSLTQRLHQDRVRTKYITRRMSRSTRQQSNGASTESVLTWLGSSYDSQQYVVTVGLGTPAIPQTFLLTTESDLTWVQCKPCNSSNCYTQKLPPFDPSRSSTYTTIPCDSQDCSDLAAGLEGNGRTGGHRECAFHIYYGSSEIMNGVYSSDSLTLSAGAVVESFHFGCGHRNDGLLGKYNGVLGLGRLPESLVGQTSTEHRGAFSICLPPTGDSTGFLAFGAPKNTSDFIFTPLLTMKDQTRFYQLMLTGISVGGQPLDIPLAVFRQGVITNSGTMISALQETAYKALRTAFRSAMAEYPLAPPVGHLDTCYNFTGYDSVTVPTVSLTFSGGATVHLDASSGVLLDGCLAFWSNEGDQYTGVIGSVTQRTIEVLYDMPGGKVGFRTGAC